ncbi:MAG: AmmeMemoRadiSam system protein A [Leptospirillia bacterium]
MRTYAGINEQDKRGDVLLDIARNAIARELGWGEGSVVPSGVPWLDAQGATFVTLRLDGELTGCIGTINAYRPLAEDVAANAVHAAFRDPRFPPLAPADFDRLNIEVSELSQPTPLTFDNEADAAARLRPGVHGVVLRLGERMGTFLPQVWVHYPDARSFLRGLKQKAGLPADFWSANIRLEVYTVVKHRVPAGVVTCDGALS